MNAAQFVEILLLGVGLSMDAAAISMTHGMVCPKGARLRAWAPPLAFGLAQGIMPLLGFLLGGLFSNLLLRYSGLCVFVILGLIGGNMIWEGLHPGEEECSQVTGFSLGVLFLQAVATSIDAFGVGISFTAMEVDILPACCIIACTTFVCSWIGIWLGRRCGDLLGSRAQILGGVMLVVIGVKSLLGL
ncbi:MAG: manganese efflux pump MntP family protein [Eubacteriales bacterium]